VWRLLFWYISSCSFVESDRHLRSACCLIALMTEAVRTSETSVNLYQTSRHKIPEDSYFQRISFILYRLLVEELVSSLWVVGTSLLLGRFKPASISHTSWMLI
jgi:hypothetical protein